MLEIVNIMLQVVTAVWTWSTTNLVPATAADVTLVHVGLWLPVILAALSFVVGLVTRRGSSRR
jgi:hypothetical protein